MTDPLAAVPVPDNGPPPLPILTTLGHAFLIVGVIAAAVVAAILLVTVLSHQTRVGADMRAYAVRFVLVAGTVAVFAFAGAVAFL